MANMTFKTSLLPNTDLGYSLGSSTQRWKINGYDPDARYVNIAGDTMTGNLIVKKSGANIIVRSSIINAIDDNDCRLNLNFSDSGSQGLWSSGYSDGTTYTASSKWLIVRGTDGNVTVNGNASTADKWKTARTLTIGNTGKSVDGSANVSWTKAEILGSGTTAQFYRGDNTWSNTLTDDLNITKAGECGVEVNNTQSANPNQVAFIVGSSGNAGIYSRRNSKWIVYNTSADRTYLADSYNGTATALAYSQAGLAASAITWLACWNGYELRAISKAETANAVDSARKFVRLTGDTMTGLLKINTNSNTVTIGSANSSWCHIENSADIPFYFNNSIGIAKGKTIGAAGNYYRPFQIYLGRNSTVGSNAINAANPLIEFSNSDRSQYGQLIYTDYDSVRSPDGLTWVGNQANSWFQAPRVFGAVWNDYAEYRETKENIQPGRCIVETGKGDLILSTERLQTGCEIVSDTFGFAIGETNICKTPTACAGRVLAYLYEDNNLAFPGQPVCSGPNGTVSLMTHEEEKEWPSRIIGTVSEIPDYDEWEYGSADEHGIKNKLKVDGRIWIRVR